MKAKLLKELMGVPAGTELEVLEVGRSWTLVAPSGVAIVVAACDLDVVPDIEPLSDPLPESDEDLPTGMPDGLVDPTDPCLLGGNPATDGPIEQLEESQLDDDDLDGELLPAPQDPCEGDESCESCQ